MRVAGRPDGAPAWFRVRGDETILIYGQPGKVKLPEQGRERFSMAGPGLPDGGAWQMMSPIAQPGRTLVVYRPGAGLRAEERV